ncbi:MAG: alpha,alpha-trehalase TreF [Saprospiraceae bacterium]|nr:alpha,alpha-trehalase TreF [Saprospiraceae bacterium]
MIRLTLPEEIYPVLFKDAALSGILQDGKILADSIPKFSPKIINEAYEKYKKGAEFDLMSFLNDHFIFKTAVLSEFKTNPQHDIIQHIERLWTSLTREPDKAIEGNSLIPLPNRYIVPGGRFNEIYYWDSYFTMLGLKVSGKTDLIVSMIDNFVYLIEKIGFIPNGNRTYFLSRSQPPFFVMMIELLAEIKGDSTFATYLPSLQKEYDFWMDGARDNETKSFANKHVLHISHLMHQSDSSPRGFLNRYWDELDSPRSEMYRDDAHLADVSDRDPGELFRDLRSACESGWDFSSRWCKEPLKLSSIHTSDIIPVDLNCLLYQLETTLSKSYKIYGDLIKSESFTKLAQIRKESIQTFFWDKEKGYYFDYGTGTLSGTSSVSAAGMFPLFFGVADEEQAVRCFGFIEKHLLVQGGIQTTNVHSGQQWDAPNGWAPLQWIAFKAALQYKNENLAMDIASRWINLNESVFKRTCKLMEKYNVVKIDLESGGGEYPVQDGFGWTNGVYLAMKEWFDNH